MQNQNNSMDDALQKREYVQRCKFVEWGKLIQIDWTLSFQDQLIYYIVILSLRMIFLIKHYKTVILITPVFYLSLWIVF